MGWIQNIKDLTEVQYHIDFARYLLEEEELPKHVHRDLYRQIVAIEERIADDSLYIAVVGRASTGKSTFINALLGTNLLKSRVTQMTTAAATFVRYGTDLTLTVRFADEGRPHELGIGEVGVATDDEMILKTDYAIQRSRVWTVTEADTPVTVLGLPGVKNMGLVELIQHITTTEEIAKEVISVTVTYPADFLKAGIVIIDTPGADATNRNHALVTRRAVERADNAIVITPAKQVVANELLKWLQDPDFLHPYINRLVFVVTGMDLIRRKKERQEVEESARQRIKDALGLATEICLFPTAAQAVVDTFSGEEIEITDGAEAAYWRQSFADLQTTLFEMLVQQRARTISERVLELLNNLFGAIEGELEVLWKDYEAQAAQLEDIIVDIDDFGQAQQRKCDDEMRRTHQKAKDAASIAVGYERDVAIRDILNDINNASNANELKAVIENRVPFHMKYAMNKIDEKASAANHILMDQGQVSSQQFEAAFDEIYDQLLIVGKRPSRDRAVNTGLSALSIGSITHGTSIEMGEFNMGMFLGGAAIGAVIGSVLMPGFGTWAGAALGGLLSQNSGPPISEQRSKVWNQLRPKIVSHFDTVDRNVQQSIQSNYNSVRQELGEMISENVQTYSTEVTTIRSNQQKERLFLERRQSNIRNLLDELKYRRVQVNRQKEQIWDDFTRRC